MEGHSHKGSIKLDTVKPKTFYWSSVISPYSIACLSKNTGTKTEITAYLEICTSSRTTVVFF